MRTLRSAGDLELSDFAQFVVHDTFVATAVLTSKSPSKSNDKSGAQVDVVKEVLFSAHESGLEVEFGVVGANSNNTQSLHDKSIDGEESKDSDLISDVVEDSREKYVITLIAPGRVPAGFVANVSQTIRDHQGNIGSINRLSDEGGEYSCFEFSFTIKSDERVIHSLRKELFAHGRMEKNADIALQKSKVSLRAKRLIVFDLSHTLIQGDAVDILLATSNVTLSKDKEEKRLKRELKGAELLLERCLALRGVNGEQAVNRAREMIKYTKGAKELCKGLKRLGYRTAVVSSGSKLIANVAKEDLGLDFVYGNDFNVDHNGCFTGSVVEPLVDADRKADLVQMLAMQERIDLDQVICVGDGPVSSKMLSMAGLSIAFDQPDASVEDAGGRISSKSLASVLYLLGIRGRDFNHVLR